MSMSFVMSSAKGCQNCRRRRFNEQTTDQEITQIVGVKMYSGNDNNNTDVPGALQFGPGVYLCGQE